MVTAGSATVTTEPANVKAPTGVVVPQPTSTGDPRPTATRAVRKPLVPMSHAASLIATRLVAGTTLVNESFAGSSTAANAWTVIGTPCLTAGTAATPTTSIPACGAATAPVDAAGSGALQLTAPANEIGSLVMTSAPVSTANGLSVTFTDYSFDGTTPGADGITLFLTDASQPVPTVIGALGGSLGYASQTGWPGLVSGYVGIGFDEYGNYSNPTQGRIGGPGQIAETVAVRGAAAQGYPYLGGATNSSGVAASLPFTLDQPTLTTRPANAPTITISLTSAGALTIAIDHHDGNGSVVYYSQTIVGVGSQPAVPANVYIGMTGSTGGNYNRHQIGGFSISTLSAAVTPTPAPTASPAPTAPPTGSGFVPTQIPNLNEWLDASDATTITQAASKVSLWKDKSGSGNNVAQATAAVQPAYTATGIDGRGSLVFNAKAYLTGSNASFSTNLFNASTVFVVSNETSTADSSIIWSGLYLNNPRWNLRLSETGVTHYDFNNKAEGRLTATDVPTGAAMWTAQGSQAAHSQLIRKNGNTLASSTGPAAAVTGNYPIVIGATAGGGAVSYQYTGQLGEILTFNRVLTSTETAEVEGYLACKWGLQNRLPANHPYKNVCPQGGTSTPIATPAPSGNALITPPQLISANGSLTFNVSVTQNATTGNPQLTYNGSSVPPTLRLLPGDTLVVNFTNSLPTPPAGAAYTNMSSLHYHGLHVSPNAPADDSIDMVAAPGQTLHYTIPIPATHPPGLYWYHTHAHGETERQTLAGISGALIIDGIASYTPAVANMPERVLVVRDTVLSGQALPAANRNQVKAMEWAMQKGVHVHGAPKYTTGKAAPMPGMEGMSGMSGMSGMAGMNMNAAPRPQPTELHGRTTALTRNPYVLVDPSYRKFVRAQLTASTHCTGTTEAAVKNWTVNGQTQPSIGIRPGEQQFWRVVNAGSDTYLDLQVDNTNMQIIALDGVPLASGVGTPASMTVSHYVIPPASRVEFIITGPPSGKTAYLRTNCFDSGSAGPAMPAAILGTINATSSPTDNIAHRITASRLITGKKFAFHTAAYIKSQAVARTQTVNYSDQNTINGIAYDPAAPPAFYAQSGTVEEWTIVNTSQQVHTFHMHQIHFVVEAINGITQGQQFVEDNVNVSPATSSGPGTVKVLLDFTDPIDIGTFLLHCHILAHEDGGMMAKIRVGTAPPFSLSSSALTFASPTAAAQTVTITGGQAPYSVTGCTNVANAAITGTSISVTPVGAGGCVLTVSDSSGLTGTIGITVTGAASAMTLLPTGVSFTSPTAAAQPVTITGGIAPYSASGCAGIASLGISGSTLTVTPAAAGTCTVTVHDSSTNSATLSVSVNSVSGGSPTDNLTFHQNTARQGWYNHETSLTQANVNGSSFGLLTTLAAPSGSTAFGKVYSQPLYVTSETVANGTTHNLVIVATSTDQVYAFDDATDTVVWHRDFTNPAGGITNQQWTDTGCGDVNPNVGITGTPVIDRTLDRMYVVVPTKENGTFHLRIHAISLKSGLEATNGATQIGPTDITATVTLASGGAASVSPEWNFNRASLLEANGNIYVALGSHCDYNQSNTHGWVLSYSNATLAQTGNMLDLTNANTGNNYFLGSPWMSGYGPAADAQGNIYFATGNGPFNGTSDFSMSIIKVPGTLDITKATYFSPNGEAADSNIDADLGSGGVMLFPDQTQGGIPHLMIGGGKCGAGGSTGTVGCRKWLLNRDNMGGKNAGDTGTVWNADTGGGVWGGPSYFADASGNQYVVYGTGYPLNLYKLGFNPDNLTVVASANVGCLECRTQGSQTIVSSNGTTAGTAVIWGLKTAPNAGGNISLYAFNGSSMAVLYNGVAGSWNVTSGASYIGGAFVSPTVANGKVYVPVDGGVAVFGLK